jgi:GH15 family glucan-1,4-alpha-glucosidase
MSTLDLGLIGNCAISALIDRQARVVWSCLPRFDGDPVFHALVNGEINADSRGMWAIELVGQERSEQFYARNTAVLVTRLFGAGGSAIEIIDFCPRYEMRGRIFRPQTLVRRVRWLAGAPRIRVVLKPSFGYGQHVPQVSHGSNHIRYVGPDRVLRLTTTAPVSYVLASTPFQLEGEYAFILGADESVREGIEHTVREFQEETENYWRLWVRRLALPLEWQDAVIRAAVTLKLHVFEETGAIIAAMTTSIPEAPGTQRNWDYRYCWLRDAFFVVRALNSLSAVESMELYLGYIANVVNLAEDGFIQPVFGIGLEKQLTEYEATALAGYRGHRPVRVGNQAHEHVQHDVYGNVLLAAAQSFFDERLMRVPQLADYEQLQRVGERAFLVHDTPDAGMWELRTRARVHTSSTLMCWAACDRLAKIAAHLKRTDDAMLWHDRATQIRSAIETRAWNAEIGSYAESFGGSDVEAGLLLMAEVGYVKASDPRFLGTVSTIEKRLLRGGHLFRYAMADDFGLPETAFNVCTFWYVDVLTRMGRIDEARKRFEGILAVRNHLGLLSEDSNPVTGELWGNFPQTYSMVGIINAATRLSRRWEEVV